MPRDLLERLESWKTLFGPPYSDQLERLLVTTSRRSFPDPDSLIRLHETLLFLRAYPPNPRVARLADQILFSFADRLAALRAAGVDLTPFEEPEVSGIAATSLSAVFSYEVARRLAERYPRNLEIDWERYEDTGNLGPVVHRFLPLLEEDWPVEADPPYRDWIRAARPRGSSNLAWLLDRISRLPLPEPAKAELFDSLHLPLAWRLGSSRATRSRLRLAPRKLYFHQERLLRRGDISLERELEGPPLPLTRLSPSQARKILDVILDTSAMRYRELYGFTHPDANRVFRADADRGVEIYFFGVPSEWRLPLRAYHSAMFFKNGVPAGYIEVLSLFERAEVGFNLYYTFREGESAWLYARLLRLLRQLLGVTCFSVDPYQIGFENEEAIESGAFWFYRKLGFRPTGAEPARILDREERKMQREPGHRSSKATLEKLAAGYLLLETGRGQPGAWDRFRIRNIGFAVQRAMAQRFDGDAEKMKRAAQLLASRLLGVESTGALTLVLPLIPDLPRWTKDEKLALAAILRAKSAPDESRYLRLAQRHPRLRTALLRLGSS